MNRLTIKRDLRVDRGARAYWTSWICERLVQRVATISSVASPVKVEWTKQRIRFCMVYPWYTQPFWHYFCWWINTTLRNWGEHVHPSLPPGNAIGFNKKILKDVALLRQRENINDFENNHNYGLDTWNWVKRVFVRISYEKDNSEWKIVDKMHWECRTKNNSKRVAIILR